MCILIGNSLWNKTTFSDVTIRFSGNEVRCHKAVLCTASEYFEALCGPQSKFIESERTTIELYEDDPIALEAVLRYIYNFSYTEIVHRLGDFHANTHVNVIMAAKKYLLPKLASDALVALEAEIADIEDQLQMSGTGEGVLEIIELLMTHKEQDASFERRIKVLTHRYMDYLFRLKRFRSLVETDDGTRILDDVTRTVDLGNRLLSAKQYGPVQVERVEMAQCDGCKLSWRILGVENCPRCTCLNVSRYVKHWV